MAHDGSIAAKQLTQPADRPMKRTGAIVIGGTAWARMTVFAEPLPLRSSGASRNEPQPVLTGATHQG